MKIGDLKDLGNGLFITVNRVTSMSSRISICNNKGIICVRGAKEINKKIPFSLEKDTTYFSKAIDVKFYDDGRISGFDFKLGEGVGMEISY